MTAFSGKSIYLFGDSQIEGIAATLTRLFGAAGARVTTSAHRGMSLSEGALFSSLGTRYDVIVVSLGGNAPPSSEGEALRQMEAFLEPLHGKEVWWITVLPSTDSAQTQARARMAQWQHKHLPSLGVRVLDGASLSNGLPRNDEIHLTAAGYRQLATNLYNAMTNSSTSWIAPTIAGATIGAMAAWWRQRRLRRG